MHDGDISDIEKIIGYVFSNKDLLVRAFTHSSVCVDTTRNYESLEFLGDSLLDFIVAKALLSLNPKADEGFLTQRRAELVSQEPLNNSIERLGLNKFLIVGKGEKLGHITKHTKVNSNLFEAVVGAIYLDSESVEAAEKFVLLALGDYIDGKNQKEIEHDYKTELNEYGSKHKIAVIYNHIGKSGPSHDPRFEVEVTLDGNVFGKGLGRTKRHAEQEAAMAALNAIYANALEKHQN